MALNNNFTMRHFIYLPFLFCIYFFGGGALPAVAFVPNLITQKTLNDIVVISTPELSQAFYGQMENFPHTYEIHSDIPFTLYTHILVPDITSSKNIVSGIIIKEPVRSGRVTEIARLEAKDAAWTKWFEWRGGDSYREGAVFEKELEAGTYRIEVHTPDNLEKYVLVVGKREEMSIGYFELIRRLMGVKRFFEKSPVLIIMSPYVYAPLLGIGVVGGVLWYRQRRQVLS
jgi:hypothetical protein